MSLADCLGSSCKHAIMLSTDALTSPLIFSDADWSSFDMASSALTLLSNSNVFIAVFMMELCCETEVVGVVHTGKDEETGCSDCC